MALGYHGTDRPPAVGSSLDNADGQNPGGSIAFRTVSWVPTGEPHPLLIGIDGIAMIHVIATIELSPGRREDFLAEFRRVVPHVRAEDGCIEYGPAVDAQSGIAARLPPARTSSRSSRSGLVSSSSIGTSTRRICGSTGSGSRSWSPG